MKRMLAVLLSLAMVLAFTACASNDAQTKPSESSPQGSNAGANNSAATAPNTEASNETYTFVVSTHTPAAATATQVFTNFLAEIESRSDGRIKFDVYTDGTLAAVDGVIDAVSSGVADIAVINYARQAGRLEMVGLAGLPGVFANTWEGANAFQELFDTEPAMSADFDAAGLKMIGIQMNEGVTIMAKGEINDLKDLSGKKVIAIGATTTEIFGSLGAVPLGLSNQEAYEAISKGTADVVGSTSIPGGIGFGLHEVVDCIYHINLGAAPLVYCMNKDKWDQLPADLQAVFNDVAHDFQPTNTYTVYALELGKDPSSLEQFAQAGVTIVEPTAAQVKDFQDNYARASWDAWASSMDAAGKPGTEMLEAFIALCEKHTGTCPDFE